MSIPSFRQIKMLLLTTFMLALLSAAAEEVSSDESALLQMPLKMEKQQHQHLAVVHKGVQNKSKHEKQQKRHHAHRQEPDEEDNSVAAQTGVSGNAAGDLAVLLAAIQANIIAICLFVGIFLVLARYYPNMYAFRATGAWGQPKDAAIQWEADDYQWFRWIKVSYACTFEQHIETCGLDSAMLLRHFVMAMEIMLWIGIPNALILSPLYCFFGGDFAGEDYLSYLGINNVTWPSEEYSWIFWPVAIMTWYNVLVIQWRLFKWQQYFIGFRNLWLERMPAPRDTTILVEGIDDDVCSDAELKKYYELMYGYGEIVEAFVVKKIQSLQAMIEEYKAADQNLHEVQYFIQKNPDKPKPTFRMGGGDEETYYAEEKRRLTTAIKEEQARINLEAKKAPDATDIYATNGFVTFKSRRQCEQALMTRLRADQGSFVMSVAPDPSDVIWDDLEMPLAKQEFLQVIGWALVVVLGVFYMPLVVGISNLGSPATLEKIEPFKSLFESNPSMRDTVAGMTGALGLTFMASMLPTFLMIIFYNFFYLRANRWAQLQLQKFYFWFLVIFVLLITACGTSFTETLSKIAQSPFYLFVLLADTMPMTTHFYMNYQVLQWTTASMNMLRYINLTKYFLFARFCDRERARALAEPEDQDYYGIGSRNSQSTMMFLIGVIFGTICPLQTLFSFVTFLLYRLFYGYLIPFCETRKPDLGGDHWVQQMYHIHYGVFIYIILMVGVIGQRATTKGPCYFAAVSFVWWGLSYYKFQTKLSWETLAFEEVVKTEKVTFEKRKPTADSYRQAWLSPDILSKIEIK
mmetsp:Transcript_39057/g.72304  ORF Transcript_39057/g.72304 Transcript_39057/m.72304 type:complete len:802 (-) Transcript_39057:47-2452(-)